MLEPPTSESSSGAEGGVAAGGGAAVGGAASGGGSGAVVMGGAGGAAVVGGSVLAAAAVGAGIGEGIDMATGGRYSHGVANGLGLDIDGEDEEPADPRICDPTKLLANDYKRLKYHDKKGEDFYRVYPLDESSGYTPKECDEIYEEMLRHFDRVSGKWYDKKSKEFRYDGRMGSGDRKRIREEMQAWYANCLAGR